MSITVPDLFRLTYLSLRGNLVRSALTSLGVFMGVAAVNATLQARDISQVMITERLAEREAPQVNVYVGAVDFDIQDLDFLASRLSEAKAISGSTFASGGTAYFQTEQAEPEVSPVFANFLEVSGRQLLQGRFINQTDMEEYRSVVVVDQQLVDTLFLGENPVNQRLYLNNRAYHVVGVVETKLSEWSEPKGVVLFPFSLHQVQTGRSQLDRLSLRPYRLENLDQLSEAATQLLKERFPGEDFYTWNNVRDIKQQQQITVIASRVLLVVGGVALTVGGVGIANITIASVRERTGEIGLRRAVGATQTEILVQFLTEAITLSLIGGVSAIAFIQVTILVVVNTFELPYQFNPRTPLFAFASALVVGVGSGFLPAWKASQLEPVQALRSS